MNVEGTESFHATQLDFETLVPLLHACGLRSSAMIRRAADPRVEQRTHQRHQTCSQSAQSSWPRRYDHSPWKFPLAVAVPTTIMLSMPSSHLAEGHGMSTETVLELWSQQPRVLIMNGAETGITTTAEVMNSRETSVASKFCMKSSCGKTVSNSMETHCITSKLFTRSLMLSLRTLMQFVPMDESDWQASVKRQMMLSQIQRSVVKKAPSKTQS